MIILKSAITWISIAAVCVAQSVSISGVVKDSQSGTVLKSAGVRLLRGDLSSTTDDAGAFSITGQVGIIPKGNQDTELSIPMVYTDGTVFLMIDRKSRVNVSILTPLGKTLNLTTMDMEPGQRINTFQEIPAGLYLFKINVGDDSFVRMATVMRRGNLTIDCSKKSSLPSKDPAKRSNSYVDTLIVSHSGYVTAIQGISQLVVADLVIPLKKPSSTPEGMRLISSAGKSFDMGESTVEKCTPVHKVQFTYDYWIDTTEVTQGSYSSVMKAGYAGYADPIWTTRGTGSNYPAYSVSWYDALLYCNALTKQSGSMDTVYSYTGNTGPVGVKSELTGVKKDISKSGFRLPTEAEWEYACRAGTTTMYYWGDSPDNAAEYAWYDPICSQKNNPVAQKKPNAWGLYDMLGNSWERCHDYFGPFTSETQTDPLEPDSIAGGMVVIKGGGWRSPVGSIKCGLRLQHAFGNTDNGVGFRVAKPVR